MTPREERDSYKSSLERLTTDEVRDEFHLPADRGVFQSAEGELAPLKASDAAKLALDIRKAARNAGGDIMIEIAQDDAQPSATAEFDA